MVWWFKRRIILSGLWIDIGGKIQADFHPRHHRLSEISGEEREGWDDEEDLLMEWPCNIAISGKVGRWEGTFIYY